MLAGSSGPSAFSLLAALCSLVPCVKTLPFNVVEGGYRALRDQQKLLDQAQRAEAWFSLVCIVCVCFQ